MARSERWTVGLVLVVWWALTGPALAKFIQGNTITCANEGKEVSIPWISEDPCIHCTCQKSEVVCTKEKCPRAASCYFLAKGSKKICCETCAGCSFQGRLYESGTNWTDPQDPCKKYICLSGVLTEYTTLCNVPCSHPTPAKEGTCCPTCSGCFHRGTHYQEGDIILSSFDNPCDPCICKGGHILCEKQACPVLPCPPSKFAHRSDFCCPECRGTKSLLIKPQECTIGLISIKDGQRLSYDQCTECYCSNTTSICTRKVCPVVECPIMHQEFAPDGCCKQCKRPEERKAICTYKGTHYESGNTWVMDKCTRCNCKDGQVTCGVEECPPLFRCPPRHMKKIPSGGCCPECVEDDGVCTVFGDPHYHTLDGMFYDFKGPCKYTLVSDCKGKTFSVLVANDPKRYSTKSVTFKADGTRVVLGQYWSVKIGKKRVKLPYLKLGVFSIRQEENYVVLRSNLGIRITWDGESYLEVSVPPIYKNQTCGLCGNFNGNKSDEFLTKRGANVTEASVFANSWMVGKRRNRCPANNVVAECHQTFDGRLQTIRDCNVLKLALFKPCHNIVSAIPYFHACLMDMCDCMPGRCHCKAMTAYSRECERAGVSLVWRNSTVCEEGFCSKGSVFNKCTSPCKKTCTASSRSCTKKCRPGCDCPAGTVWHKQECIPSEKCPPPPPHLS